MIDCSVCDKRFKCFLTKSVTCPKYLEENSKVLNKLKAQTTEIEHETRRSNSRVKEEEKGVERLRDEDALSKALEFCNEQMIAYARRTLKNRYRIAHIDTLSSLNQEHIRLQDEWRIEDARLRKEARKFHSDQMKGT